MSKTKMIALSFQNWESLRKFGEYGDSMNTIVSKILARVDTLPSQSRDNKDVIGVTSANNRMDTITDSNPSSAGAGVDIP